MFGFFRAIFGRPLPLEKRRKKMKFPKCPNCGKKEWYQAGGVIGGSGFYSGSQLRQIFKCKNCGLKKTLYDRIDVWNEVSW
jgi:predicted RNA-binding Zn-ribbon protein involved in translation (DUF1610 family)